MGLLELRRNDPEAAEMWVTRSMEGPEGPAQLVASNRILLAMIRIRSGETDEARELLDQAGEAIARWEAEPFRVGTSVNLWFDWGNARILLSEAGQMLEDARPP